MPRNPSPSALLPARPRRRGRPAASAPQDIPRFTLYGDTEGARVDRLHVETLQSRSQLYQGEIDAHVHAGHYQLFWLRRGPAEVALDESRSRCEGPAVIAVPPGVVHAFRFSAATDGMVVTLSPHALTEGDPPIEPAALDALFGRPQVQPLDIGNEAVGRLDSLFEQLGREFGAPGLDSGPVPLWLARAAVWRLAQVVARQSDAAQPQGGARHALHLRFLALVEAHFLEHWPVAKYAQRLGTSTDRLNRVAQQHAGRSALALIHDRLLREACRRLVYLVAPVSRLAFELGFEDPAYFSRFFRRGTGMSPGEYRSTRGGELPSRGILPTADAGRRPTA